MRTRNAEHAAAVARQVLSELYAMPPTTSLRRMPAARRKTIERAVVELSRMIRSKR